MKIKLPKQYEGVYKSFRNYLTAYGGMLDIIKSPYLHLAVLITIFSFEGWLYNHDWEKIIVTAAPPFIAFSLGAAAIFNSIGDKSFREMLLDYIPDGKNDSAYVEISSQLVHFIVVQTFALLLALISITGPTKSLSKYVNNNPCSELIFTFLISGFKFFTYLTFVYGCLLVFATVMLIFNVSRNISINYTSDKVIRKNSSYKDKSQDR